jgi:hypothetical protein
MQKGWSHSLQWSKFQIDAGRWPNLGNDFTYFEMAFKIVKQME